MELDHLLESLAATPYKLAHFIAGLSEPELHKRKAGDEFSPLENVCHLRDLEVEGYALRITRILTEDNPTLADFDGARIAAERDYNSEDIRAALETFTSTRSNNINRIKSLAAQGLQRPATLVGAGTITLKDLLHMMLDHDDGHLRTLI